MEMLVTHAHQEDDGLEIPWSSRTGRSRACDFSTHSNEAFKNFDRVGNNA
jgi:hypothetical protein